MSIEQSIFTCCRARRETGTTGFGYYSLTEGMDEMRKNSIELSMLSNNYSAPRNQELWWSNEQDEALRDEQEALAIREHHPAAFGYRVLEVGGVKKAVFTFGKNIGRDIQGFRPGNILVNTIVADLDEVTEYPFEYFGSPEIFTDYDRSFFVNAPDTPADMLDNPPVLHTGGRITREDAAEFIAADERRLDMLLSMIQFVLDRNDPERTSRQVMICDRMENIIYWAAAVSIAFPKELAKQFSFSTYSFLGSADSSSVSLEDIMLCGVYSAAVNGDEPDPRATNYDYDFEAQREESALFDFEHDFYTNADLRSSGFMMLVRSAMTGSFDQLDEFQRFIMEKTSCRTIGSDYAKGCGCFLIEKMRRQQSLAYLGEALDFAGKYMGAETVRTLLEIAYSCTLDQDDMSRYFDDIIAVSKSCAKNSGEDKQFVYEHCLRFVRDAFMSQSLSRDEYMTAKNSVREIFEEQGDSFEQAFISSLDSDVISSRIVTIEKKWILLELAELLCRDAAASGKDLFSRDCVMMLTAAYRAIKSETEKRRELIGVYADMFGSIDDRLKLYDLLIARADNDGAVKADLIGSLAELAVSDAELSGSIFAFAAESPYCDMLYDECVKQTAELDPALDMFTAMLGSSAAYDRFLPEICDRLLDLCESGDCDEQIDNIYQVFLFAEDNDALRDCGKNLCIEFCNTLFNKGVWYKLNERTGDILRELVEGSGSDHFAADPSAHNIFVMYFITRFADIVDESQVPYPVERVGFIDLKEINDEEYPDVVKTIAHSFARRSIVTGSAVGVRYDLFINVHEQPHPGILEDVVMRWFHEILKTAPKESRTRLAAHLIAIMHCDCSMNFEKIGMMLHENKLKSVDVIRCLDDRDVLKFISGCGSTEQALRRTASDIATGCEKAKQNSSVLGNLFSRFGKKG